MPKQPMNRVVGLERCVTERVIQVRYLDLDDTDVGNAFGKAPPTALLS